MGDDIMSPMWVFGVRGCWPLAGPWTFPGSSPLRFFGLGPACRYWLVMAAKVCVCMCVQARACVCTLSHVQLFVTPMDCSPPGLLCPWDSPGKSTGVGCHSPLQGISATQGLNPCLLHWGQILYHWATREAGWVCWTWLMSFSASPARVASSLLTQPLTCYNLSTLLPFSSSGPRRVSVRHYSSVPLSSLGVPRVVYVLFLNFSPTWEEERPGNESGTSAFSWYCGPGISNFWGLLCWCRTWWAQGAP